MKRLASLVSICLCVCLLLTSFNGSFHFSVQAQDITAGQDVKTNDVENLTDVNDVILTYNSLSRDAVPDIV
ncbi:MAG TPA: hypothetical protein DDZ99_11285, partial [Clostridiales bacterium]|nr:hypothetical protein [Clostridiales bacterium]